MPDNLLSYKLKPGDNESILKYCYYVGVGNFILYKKIPKIIVPSLATRK